MSKIAENITIDLENKEIRIDGWIFPYHVTPDIELAYDGKSNGRLPSVRLEILTKSLNYIPVQDIRVESPA